MVGIVISKVDVYWHENNKNKNKKIARKKIFQKSILIQKYLKIYFCVPYEQGIHNAYSLITPNHNRSNFFSYNKLFKASSFKL